MFPDEASAKAWFEEQRRPDSVCCAHCQSSRVSAVKNGNPMPWRCKDCRRHFSVRIGTVMEQSPLPLRKWGFTIRLCATGLKSVSSMKLHRDPDIAQSSAWFMAHRIREAMECAGGMFAGPVEVGETFIGGKRKNMPRRKHRVLTGRGAVGKLAVAGATLQGFARARAEAGAKVYTGRDGFGLGTNRGRG